MANIKPFCNHERFQMFCQFCKRIFEADSTDEVYSLVLEHEKECPRRGEEINKIVSGFSSDASKET